MTITLKMYAPAAGQQYTTRDGSIYTSDSFQFISGVTPEDVNDLENSGCVSLGQAQARSNLTATTNPTATDDTTKDYGIGSRWVNTTTGAEYVATVVTASAAVWNLVSGSYLGLPWVTGRAYGIPPGNTQAAVLTVTATLYAVPVFIPNKVTLDKISVSVTTGQTGGKARCALFADSAGYPGAIVAGTDTGDLAATATAVVASAALAKVLYPGWYWLGSIFTATTTFPSVVGSTAIYPDFHNALLGCATASDALATSGKAVTGIAITGQTYPVTDMPTSFPTFPASAALQSNVTTPIAAFGV